MNGILKVIGIGDLHFGHPRINAESLYKKLRACLYPELKDTHLLMLTGDTYDQLLTVNSKAYHFACMFISDLLNISSQTGMQVRILHGTFTHDRDQLSVFNTLHIPLPRARFKVINSIYVEEITELRAMDEELPIKLHVGYIPDNLPYKYSTDAVEQLKNMMTVAGYDRLDILVGHGTFEHVTVNTAHKPACLFTIQQFERIVQGPIIMGHIHTPGNTRNVYYCGSFERIAHGEEEDKGFYVFTEDTRQPNSWRARFVKNTFTVPFYTITPEVTTDIPKITQAFITNVEELFPHKRGYLRVLHPSAEVRTLLHRICAENFPDIVYSSKSTGDQEHVEMKIEEIQLDILDDIKPNVNNLGDLVYQFLEEHQLLDDVPKERIFSLMNVLLSGG